MLRWKGWQYCHSVGITYSSYIQRVGGDERMSIVGGSKNLMGLALMMFS